MKKFLLAFGLFLSGFLFYLVNTGNAQFVSQWLLSNDGTKLLSRVSTVTEICQSDGTTCTGFSGGTPAGTNTQVQFNNNGSFGASSDLTFNDSTDTMSVANITSLSTLAGVSGGLTISTVGNGDISIEPNGTGTVGITSSLDIGGSWTITELSADPSNPAEGKTTCWQSDGTGTGDDGDIYCSTTAGATTKDIQVTDFSAGTLASAGGASTAGQTILAKRTTDLNIGSGGTTVAFNTENGDTDNEYNTSTGQFTAEGAGLRQVEYFINTINNGINNVQNWRLLVNSTEVLGGRIRDGDQFTMISFLYNFSDNDVVELKLYAGGNFGTLRGSTTFIYQASYARFVRLF